MKVLVPLGTRPEIVKLAPVVRTLRERGFEVVTVATGQHYDPSLTDAFSVCDEVLLKATKGISDLVTVPGLVNLDFADVKAVMSNRGNALMGTGRASGERRAILFSHLTNCNKNLIRPMFASLQRVCRAARRRLHWSPRPRIAG